jgi:hypothetical protein
MAPASHEKLHPTRGEWRQLLVYGVLGYGAFSVFTTLSLGWLNAYTLPVWASLLA